MHPNNYFPQRARCRGRGSIGSPLLSPGGLSGWPAASSGAPADLSFLRITQQSAQCSALDFTNHIHRCTCQSADLCSQGGHESFVQNSVLIINKSTEQSEVTYYSLLLYSNFKFLERMSRFLSQVRAQRDAEIPSASPLNDSNPHIPKICLKPFKAKNVYCVPWARH